VFNHTSSVDRTAAAAASCSPLLVISTPRRGTSPSTAGGASTTINMGLPPMTATTAPATSTTTIDLWNQHRDELDLVALPARCRPSSSAVSTNMTMTARRGPTPDTINNETLHGSTSTRTTAQMTSFWPKNSYDESSDDDYGATTYATKYCERHNNKTTKNNSPLRIHLPQQRQRRQLQEQQQQEQEPPSQHRKVLNPSCSRSFDTVETHQTEEESASTFSSFDEIKTVRWRDYSLSGELLATHYSYDAEETHTCRIVILLLLNNGSACAPEENFEFLHCEYIVPDKLKVSNVLTQISALVASPDDENNATNRPFTALFHQGLEMINALAVQDFDLQDGRSILIAIRHGEQSTSVILRQAAVLLRDKMLLSELRKARIAGRSLQLLHSNSSTTRRRSGSGDHGDHHQPAVSSNPAMELTSVGSFRDVSTEACECGCG
jgi:hypothetical protein